MKRWPIAAFALIILLAGGVFWYAISRPVTKESGKLKVVTTLFPFYDFARQIGGDKVEVTLLLPPGVEPHSFEPRPSDILKINQAGVFVYTGKVLEPWAASLVSSLPASVKTVDASAGIDLLPAVFHDADEPAGASDPHIWLDFDNDRKIVTAIGAAMAAADPANAETYLHYADIYASLLANEDVAFRIGLDDCATRELVYGGHYALGYLAKRYNLTYLAAQGVSPNAEPTARDLAAMVEQIKNNGIKYIFYEELESPKIAQTLADETGAKLILVNAAHNVSRDDIGKGKTFIDIMAENLENLKIGLQCRVK